MNRRSSVRIDPKVTMHNRGISETFKANALVTVRGKPKHKLTFLQTTSRPAKHFMACGN